ncbi:protein kinase family protein [Streptomyces sp. N2-109]|uniref:Protein kinase family protein n=1 Tax=Streptomyces gossypii TaxID=2883101 RepID=A0ABT2JMX1_9ACTN|nr:protein kinase family protein [Streptomyces gossypii]MCT2589229.1 protein kinase family protein [Streptomyces gossypii]
MVERSTAAVDVASTSGEEKPLSAEAGGATADGVSDGHDDRDTTTEPEADTEAEAEAATGQDPAEQAPAPEDGADAEEATEAAQDTDGEAGETEAPPAPPEPDTTPAVSSAPATASTPSAQPAPPRELHSGHKLAQRYRLEECVTRLDGFSSWRAVDEKLRRAVGVHLLPADHPRARPALAAARSAALLGDPRFVQVLDAVEDDDLVYIVHEWLPDATPLTELLLAGPLTAHEAYQLVTQLAQALAAAHREGLAHLRITPASVLRTGSGQYRVRGLAVSAALRGVASDHPQRADTEAIGALLYAALTARWPYEEDAYGLGGVGALADTLVAPDQVRAGVHRGLSELAMRALVNDGATASRQEKPCATPEELAKAVAVLPRIRPPEPTFSTPPAYRRTGRPYGPGGAAQPGAGGPTGRTAPPPPTPPALPGRTGKALKWGVSALLIAALGLGSWQVADTLMNRDTHTDRPPAQTEDKPDPDPVSNAPIKIVDGKDFDPSGDGSENPESVPKVFDGDPESFWYTRNYYGQPDFGNLKPGVGVILDLGKSQEISSVKVRFDGETSAELLAAPKDTDTMPSTYEAFRKLADDTGQRLDHTAKKPVTTRYVLVWLTKLPLATDGNYRGRITDVRISG